MTLAERESRARKVLLELACEGRDHDRVAVIERGVEEMSDGQRPGRYPVGIHEPLALGISERYVRGDIEFHHHFRVGKKPSQPGVPTEVEDRCAVLRYPAGVNMLDSPLDLLGGAPFPVERAAAAAAPKACQRGDSLLVAVLQLIDK